MALYHLQTRRHMIKSYNQAHELAFMPFYAAKEHIIIVHMHHLQLQFLFGDKINRRH